ncbi:Dipeptidyl aminopeptidase/acylaminoacyl peptidase [Granulicella pectinivorans]|uniref:Dipeptidyl aminopeptidase/acylaminoacyl peptidase n=1 Tax=Granulicella pectinivorans TaxID=474950 RepID=A0A1I6LWP8_9BACT|nr:S9 family peptidase [Granulicella pectinivorans]SFS07835.1 Dipeptidyl aminopeptidase/acylaminoacyl peptidase [Granulicella pectinivorans]
MNRFVRSILCAVLMGTTGAALAQAKRPMTFEDLMAMKRVADPQISSGGKWVLFSVTDVSLTANTKINRLWVVPIGGGKERDLGLPAGASNGRFSPDGKWVSFTGNDDTGSQIWLAAWDEASGTIHGVRRLTAVSTEADGAIWSPNSKRLLFVSSVYPDCSDKAVFTDEDACNKAKDDAAAKNPVKAQVWDHLLYRHWNAFTGEKRSHVLVVSVGDSSVVRDLTPKRFVGDAETPTFSLGGPLGYAWSPGSDEIAFVTNLDTVPAASTNNDVFTLLLDDAGAKPRKISTSPGSDDGPQYSPDGKWIAFRSQARAGFESDRFRLVLFDRLAGTLKELMPKLNTPPGGYFDGWIDEFVWNGDSTSLVFTSGVRGAEAIFSYDVFGFRRGGDPLFLRWSGEGEYGDLHLFIDRSATEQTTLVATRMSAEGPTELVTIPMGLLGHTALNEFMSPEFVQPVSLMEPKETRLTHINDGALDSVALQKMESFWFTGVENTKVQGFLVRPPNFDPSRKYPVKFLIHGGPQGAWGDAWSYRWNPELMAASGYVVVMVNPRGSTGYGQKFVDEVSGDWGGRAYIDLMNGLDAAEAKYPFIDKTRECALGASYGGFMANWILTHTNRFQCIVSHDGMYNPASAYGDTEELWFNEWEFRRPGDPNPGQPWRYAAGPAEDDPFRKWSPMLQIQNAKTPTLVIHSQKDYRLDVSEGFQLFTALQRLNVPSKMLYFPDEGHWVLKPQNAKLWNETVSDWCDRWTHSNAYASK